MRDKPYIACSIAAPLLEALQDGRLDIVALWEPLPTQPAVKPLEGFCKASNPGCTSILLVEVGSTWHCVAHRQVRDRVQCESLHGKPLGTVEVISLLTAERRGREWGLLFEVKQAG